MEQNSTSVNPMLEQIQKEYALQLAGLQFQMLQRTFALNRMMPPLPQFGLNMFPGFRLMNQLYPMPPQSLFSLGNEGLKAQHLYLPSPLAEITQQSGLSTKIIEKCLSIFEKSENPTTEKTKSSSKELLRKKLEAILEIFLIGSGFLSNQETDFIKEKLKDEPELIPVFEAISQRYQKGRKSNEEMQRYSIFRGIKWMRMQIMKRDSIKYSDTLDTFVQEYFLTHSKSQDSNTIKTFAKQIDEYGKSPRDKIINVKVTKQLFSSTKFLRDYKIFLNYIDGIMTVENDQRKTAFVVYLETCYNKSALPKIQVYKRVPWPVQWMQETKRIGIQLANSTLFDPSNRGLEEQHLSHEKRDVEEHASYEPEVQKKLCLKSPESEEPKIEFPTLDVKHESANFETKQEFKEMKKQRVQVKSEEKLEDEVSFSSALSDDANWEVDLL